jgi:IS5 family transposase
VKRVAIPRRGKPGIARQQVQRGRAFTKLVKWRTGSEARISHLKRDYGWARTRVDGIAATQAWCGWGVLAHNATKVSALLQDAGAAQAPVVPAAPAKRPTNPGTGPPRRAADAPAA